MSFQLKNYQNYVLNQLHDFLHLAKIGDVADAYQKIIDRNKDDEDSYENQYAGRYHSIVEQSTDCPHVCIRVPTAGGKTYLAAHAIGHGATYLETETPTVLWFTPTDTIRTQTTEMLKNRAHPCRIAIENRFGLDVEVYDIADFGVTRPQDFTDRTCIIVSTVQMFRSRSTDARRIYETHENFEAHFEKFLPRPPPDSLEIDSDTGKPKLSFANLLHLIRPLVILDEAHNFVSDLSREVLQRINPACVLEFTATPKAKPQDRQPLHNVLVSIPAQALYDEQMVKLPIVVCEHQDWEQAIVGALDEQKRLTKIAADNNESIRPIVLYQAQNANEEITAEKLKAHLIAAHNIAEDSIATHTGEIKELEKVGNLLAANCKIAHIITIKALVEGWDCPFAYILCSVNNVRSDTAVEQLLGRIMRMPDVRHRENDSLNRAYAHVPENIPFAAAECLRQKLADDLGFEEKEVEWAVQEKLPGGWGYDGLLVEGDEVITIETTSKPDFEQLACETKDSLDDLVSIKEISGGWSVEIKKPIPPDMQKIIIDTVPEEKRKVESIRLTLESSRLAKAQSPACRGEEFAPLPMLFFYSSEQEKEVVVNANTLYEVTRWNDIGEDCLIDDFSIEETAQTTEISLEGGSVIYEKIDHQQVFHFTEINQTYLAAWLEHKIRDSQGRYFPATLKKFISINMQKFEREYTRAQLTRAKYQFSEALKKRLTLREKEIEKRTISECVFDNKDIQCKPLFAFPQRSYDAGNNSYSGSFRFKKHYYGLIGDLKSEGEEFDCAQAIDSSPGVQFWIRNLPRKEYSYMIPPNFFPDFIVQLINGKILIVEYKGEQLAGNQKSDRNKQMGEFIECHSKDCFFIMPTRRDGEASIKAQIDNKISEILND